MKLYKQLLKLIEDDKPLDKFFSKEQDWEKMFYDLRKDEKMSSGDIELIALALNEQLSLEQWIDTNEFQIELDYNLKKNSVDINQYTWAMVVEDVRKKLSPETKGHFVKYGLFKMNHHMSYQASLDKDWVSDIHLTKNDDTALPEDHTVEIILSNELVRLKREFEDFTANQHMHYFQWMQEEILPHFSMRDQSNFLFSYFILTCLKLNDINIENMFIAEDLAKGTKEYEEYNHFSKNLSHVTDIIGFKEWHTGSQKTLLDIVRKFTMEDFYFSHYTSVFVELSDQYLPLIQKNKFEKELSNKDLSTKKFKL